MRLSSLVTTSVALSMMDNIKVTCSAALPSTPSLLRGKNNEERKLEEENLPTFVSAWEEIPDLAFPLDVGESQGTMIGTDLYSVGGFFGSLQKGPMEGFALDLSNPSATWREMAPNPIDPFLTHAAQAVKGENKIYLCGGYLGGHPGRAIDDCYVFDKADGPIGNWTQLPSLPEPRAGGGMVYIESHDALVFALGAIRPINGSADSIDLDGTWMLKLDNVAAGWQPRKTIPYRGNHVSSVVARDCAGEIHYLFLGGQIGERENDSNLPDMYEYLADTDEWVQRANMLEGRGHFTTSTVPYGCGFLVIGGAMNKNPDRFSKTNDISYYDASLDQWTSIGKLPRNYKTQVCGIYDDWLYCTCGYRVETYRRKLSFPVLPSFEASNQPSVLHSQSPSSLPSSSDSISTTSIPSFAASNQPRVSSSPLSLPTSLPMTALPSTKLSATPSSSPTRSPIASPAIAEVARLYIHVRTDPFCYSGFIVVRTRDYSNEFVGGAEVMLAIAAPAGPLTLTHTSDADGKTIFRDIVVNKIPGDSLVTACVLDGSSGEMVCNESFLTVCG